jgi:uncharacterized membrane protein
MYELVTAELERIHPAVVAFPIALLVVSVLLDLAARFQSSVRGSARLLLYLGTGGAMLATVTGLITHLRYEGTTVSGWIDQHEVAAYLTTAIFVGLSLWRGWSRRHGQEVGASWIYTALSLAGLVALTVTGALGGNLVFGHGVGVSH